MFTTSADLSGIDKLGNLYVGMVKQVAFIDLCEEGTTAAAATGNSMR